MKVSFFLFLIFVGLITKTVIKASLFLHIQVTNGNISQELSSVYSDKKHNLVFKVFPRWEAFTDKELKHFSRRKPLQPYFWGIKNSNEKINLLFSDHDLSIEKCNNTQLTKRLQDSLANEVSFMDKWPGMKAIVKPAVSKKLGLHWFRIIEYNHYDTNARTLFRTMYYIRETINAHSLVCYVDMVDSPVGINEIENGFAYN